MRSFILFAISAYQRYVSPHKGFCCAYRVHTGRKSCSVLGYRAVQRFGVRIGLAILRRRVHLCGVAYRRYQRPRARALRYQRGDCDLGCLPLDLNCDMPSGKTCSSISNMASCLDCGSCDWRDRGKKERDRDRKTRIPPRRDSTSERNA